MKMTDVMTLLDYNYWATARVLDAAAHVSPEQFAGTPNEPAASLRATLVHILSAEWLWRTRWETGASPPMMRPEDFPGLAVLQQRWQDEEQAMRVHLSTLDDSMLDDPVRFRHRSGELSTSFTRWHLLMQLVTHGTYHRSEAAALLTTYGHSPGDLDFLFFVLDRPS